MEAFLDLHDFLTLIPSAESNIRELNTKFLLMAVHFFIINRSVTWH